MQLIPLELQQEKRFSTWAMISFLYFIAVAFMGLLLRFIFIYPIPGVNFKYFLHAHSHAAILGWLFNALYVAIISEFVAPDKKSAVKYRILFILLQITVVGMIITFPLKGYYRDSIIFSTLHILLSFVFATFIYKDGRSVSKNGLAFLSIKISLFFLIISSLGPFALGGLMANDLSESHWYNLSIYYYLHFQYNGWFVFALLGLFIKLLDNLQIEYPLKKMRLVIILLATACIPAYALSALWIPPPLFVFVIGWIAVIVQILAVGIFINVILKIFPKLKAGLPAIAIGLIMIGLSFFILKNVIQFFSAFEEVARLGYEVRNFVIAYLHMVFLGFCSLFLLGWFHYKKWLVISSLIQKIGLVLFITSFLISEIFMVLYPTLIKYNSIIIPNYTQWIFILSAGMPLGLLLLFPVNRK